MKRSNNSLTKQSEIKKMIPQVTFTKHICDQYAQRFNQNLLAIKDIKDFCKACESPLKLILNDAHYISDNERGILLFSRMFNCCLIIKNRKAITMYNPDKKVTDREFKRKHRSGLPGTGNRKNNRVWTNQD